MKNWLKKQFTFPTKKLIWWTFVYSFSIYLAAMGAINIYQGTFDGPGWITAGMWQIWAGLFYWMFFGMMDSFQNIRDLYRKIIDLQNEQIDEYHKFFLDLKKVSDEADEKKKKEQGVAKPPENKGFTLIELLVVIAIIGILTAVVLSGINSCKEKVGCGKDAPTEYRN